MKGSSQPKTRRKEYLDFNIENTTFTRFDDGVDSPFAGTVKIAGEFGMFDETALIEKGDEVFTRNEVILYAVHLSWPGRASGI